MAAAPLPKLPRWAFRGECASCRRAVALTLTLSGGSLPPVGAVRLEAACAACGHVWALPPAHTGSRGARTATGVARAARLPRAPRRAVTPRRR